MQEGITRTSDKDIALMILEQCLTSKGLLDVRIQNLDGVYSVEVSRPTNKPARDDPSLAR